MTREDNKFLWIIFGVLYAFALAVGLGVTAYKLEQVPGMFYYSLSVVALFFVLGLVVAFGLKKQNASKKWIGISLGALAVACVLTILFAPYMSGDYDTFLYYWCKAYEGKSLKDALYVILDESNYTPAYNYFLILITKLGINSLYGIKFITLLFSVLLAFIVTKIVSFITKKPFNYIIFSLFMVMPQIFIEYSSWGQCDAIYTSFALLALYFALTKKSKLSFISLGVAFAFKLQFLFVCPIIFVMLIVKDKSVNEKGEHYLKWWDIWLVPAMYAINLIPALAGRSVMDLLLVYVKQSGYEDRISSCCANFPLIWHCIFRIKEGSGFIFKLLCGMHILLTFILLVLVLILIFKLNKKRNLTYNDLMFFASLFSFIMVFFMPKMHDRFFFITTILLAIWAVCNPKMRNIKLALLVNIAMLSTYVVFITYVHIELYGTLINFYAIYLFAKILIEEYMPIINDKPVIEENNKKRLKN